MTRRPGYGWIALVAWIFASGCGGGGNAPAALAISSPLIVLQTSIDVELRLDGENLREGARIEVSGEGVLVTETRFVSETEIVAVLSVSDSAPFGLRDVLYFSSGGAIEPEYTLEDAVRVWAPQPSIDAVAPAVVTQGDAAVSLTLSGQHLREGANISLGAGIEIESDWISSGEIELTIDVGAQAPLGDHTITYTQPAAGGGASTTTPAILQVHAPTPTVTSVAPEVLRQGETDVVVTVEGTAFRAGGRIAFGGSALGTGVTLVESETRASVLVAVPDDADAGPRTVGYIQPAAGGAFEATQTTQLDLHYPDPEIDTVSPNTLQQGVTDTEITLSGSGFRDGATVEISGDEVEAGTVTVNTPNEATLKLTVKSGAAVGKRDVRFIHANEGGGAAVTATESLTIEYPDPKLTAVSPAKVTQDTASIKLTLTGDHFRDGGTVTAGSGITVTEPKRISDTSFEVLLAIDGQATLGLRDVLYAQPGDGGGASVTLSDGIDVHAPVPEIASIAPTTLKQTDSAVKVTVTGKNFRNGGLISIGGTGLTLGGNQVVSATEARVFVTVDEDATIGKRDVIFTQPSIGGGAKATGAGLLTIHYPTPVITFVSPPRIAQGASETDITIQGKNLRPGGALTTSGTGVTLSEVSYVSATEYRMKAKAAATAPLGKRDLTYAHAAAGGGASQTKSDAYEIQPTLSPSQWLPGDSHISVKMLGTGFDSGSSLSVSGSGVTVHSTTFVSATELRADVTIASSAALGARDIVWTPGNSSEAPKTFKSVVQVVPAEPTVTGFAPTTIAKGATSVSVAITGTNFRDGDTIALGDGVTVKSTTVNSDRGISATVDVASDAKTGTRDVSVTRPDSAGGASSTTKALYQVVAAKPSITAMSPSSIGRTGSGGATRTVPITIAGSSFATGAALAVSKTSGSGVTVIAKDTVVVSGSTLVATLSIGSTATTGKWDLKVTNPGGLGDSGTSGASLLDIKGETTLTVNNVLPATGSPHGGDRVTIYGAGFAVGAVVDFGNVRAIGTQTIDRHTLVCTAPVPARASSTGSTAVDVKVSNPSGSPATLTNGYHYGRDDVSFRIIGSYPAHGATSVPHNLVSGALLLSGPADTTTATYGSGGGTKSRWYESAGSTVSGGLRAFGPSGRWFVFSRTSTGNLPKQSQGLYVMEIPTTLTSIGGVALRPTVLAGLGTSDQRRFTITTSTTDTTAPKLSTIRPSDKATAQNTTAAVVLTFDKPIDPRTVTTSMITFQQGSTTVPAFISVGPDLRTMTITPDAELSATTKYTTRVTAAVKDFFGNGFSATSYEFTTNDGTDKTAPTIDRVILENLPADMDGSGTYVNTSGVGGQAFDAYLPRGGWRVTVHFSDHGGAGIDETTFSAKANVAVAGANKDVELAGNFTVTSTRATWALPASGFATGDNATFTFVVKDKAATPNTSGSHVVTIDVFDLASTSSKGGDYHPFDKRNTWILRGDLDAYTASYSTSSSPARQGATTTVKSNGVLDLDESLRLVGLNTGSMSTAAAATVNGTYRGTNNIVHAIFMARVRSLMRERFSIGQDGTRYADSVNIEFLLPGEQGSLLTLPSYSTSVSSNSSKPFSEMSIGGTQGAESSAFSSTSALGRAWFDARNRRQEANINSSKSGTGVYLLSMMKYNVNASTTSFFSKTISSKLVKIHGGTPVGEDASDDDVLSDAYDRTNSSNSTHNARYDAIMDAIEALALYTSMVTAHEIGHSVGLVQDGAPKNGLFGGAHYNNTFTEATSSTKNTSAHLDYLGNDIMPASVGFDDAAQSGAEFKRFSPMNIAYLRARLGHE